jgi:hypothetical protein
MASERVKEQPPKILLKANIELLAARTCWENQNSFSSLLKCIKIRYIFAHCTLLSLFYSKSCLHHLCRWNSVPKRLHIKFRRRGITQKKEYNEKKTFPIILVTFSAQHTAILMSCNGTSVLFCNELPTGICY